jgi:hypothetical protein
LYGNISTSTILFGYDLDLVIAKLVFRPIIEIIIIGLELRDLNIMLFGNLKKASIAASVECVSLAQLIGVPLCSYYAHSGPRVNGK